MDGHDGSLQESQSSQNHQSCYSNVNQYHQTFGDYQYLPGQHWLAGSTILSHPSADHNYNGMNVGGYGGNLGHYGYNQSLNNTNSTIHHTGQQQLSMQHPQLHPACQSSQSQEQPQCQSMPYPSMYVTPDSGASSNKSSYVSQQQQPLPYLHNYCSNKYHHHVPGSVLPGFSNSCHPIQSQTPITTNNPIPSNSILPHRIPWTASSSEPSAYPGGLEIVWREVPEECQRLLSMQDVPDSAKLRGYFTVCELINLKRSLLGRLGSLETVLQPEPIVVMSEPDENVRVGIAVKEAMNTLDDSQSRKSSSEEEVDVKDVTVDPTSSRTTNVEEHPNNNSNSNIPTAEEKDKKFNDAAADEVEVSVTKPIPSQSVSSDLPDASSTTVIKTATISSTDQSKSTNSITSTVTASTSAAIMDAQTSRTQYLAPPPAYRTASLVFKLLQIGNYQIRSFSEMNPNRLRVLFNTQRITYECHLTLVKPPKDSQLGVGNVRKLLTVEIGFDQISMIRFGLNKLFLKIEGSPLLSVSYYPAEHDNTCPPLSQPDHLLLDQIDKGQLKLSPCHQIYFINERLVHLLEAQFHQHPRFRHIIEYSCESNF